MNLRTLLCAAATVVLGSSYGANVVTSNDFAKVQFGDIPANKQIATNVEDVVIKVADAIDKKADRFIAGDNLAVVEYFYKLTPSSTDSSGNPSTYLPFGFVYSNTTNVEEAVKLYNDELHAIAGRPSEEAADVGDLQWFALSRDSGTLEFQYRYQGQTVYCPVQSIEQVEGRILNAEFPEKDSYGYSHPNDWKIHWEAMEDAATAEIISTKTVTNVIGQVYKADITEVVKSGRAALTLDYLDEVNLPDFGSVTWSVLSGSGTIAGNIVTATEPGVVRVAATADNGTHREADVALYQWKTSSSEGDYQADAWPARKRVNDYHLGLLQAYRADATTNRVYTTPGGYTQVGFNGDQYDGKFAKHYFPYAHVTCNNSGYVGQWWSNTPISKHVLLTAHHYHPSAGNVIYLDWPGLLGPRVTLKVTRYQHVGTWARNNGFEGTDAVSDDMGLIVVSTADYDGGVNAGVPDQYISYVATADYLNATYGIQYGSNVIATNESNNSVYINNGLLGVSLNQVNTLSLRGLYGPDWRSFTTTYNTYSGRVRSDINAYTSMTPWHNVVGGDSGNPTFLYDPALTTGVTYDFGEGAGPEPVLRPIALYAYHTAMGGPCVPTKIKVIDAFVKSIGETLPYVLGDPTTQSSDIEVIREKAIESTKAAGFGPNAPSAE